MNNLPEKWTNVTLGEVTKINPRHAKDLDNSVPVTFTPMTALNENNWDFKEREERPLGEVRKGYTHFAEGDVLLAKITPCLENGKAAIATNLRNGLGCGTTELHVLRSQGAALPKYLYHFVHQESFRTEAAASFTGTAGQLRVPASFLSQALIPLPPLNEQRRIVEKLDKLLAKVESARARLDRVPIILKRFRQAVLAAAVSGELTKDWRERNPEVAIPHIPGEDVHISKSDTVANFYPLQWRVVRLGDLVDFVGSGITPRGGKSNYLDAGVPFIRSQNVWPSGLKLDDIVYVSEELHQKMKRTHLKEKDVLLNITGASIGRAAVIPLGFGPANVNQHVCIIRVERKLIPEFVKLFLNSPIGQDEIFSTQRGVTREGLNYGQIRSLTIPLLSFEEQKEIVRRVEALFKIADQVEARYHKAKARVDKLTQAILAKAFRGELVPQDLNDEPASVLLEKIKKEREKESRR